MTDESQLTEKKKRSLLEVILSSGFVISMAAALVVYINSPFLETLLPAKWLGYVYAVSYLATLIVMQQYGKLIKRFKNHVTLLVSITVEIVSLVLLSVNINPVISLIAFVFFIVSYSITVINYDILLEVLTSQAETGRMRGVFWTAVNLAWVFGPIIAGTLVSRFGFSVVYMVSAIILIFPWLLIFFTYRGEGHEHFEKHRPLKKTLKRIMNDHNLKGIFMIAFVLYFFYAWMVIYTPLHMLDLGFSWEQIGQIFTIMLIPFVLVEYPAGWLADKYIGETEMLSVGFLIMSISVLLFAYASGFWYVMILLFISRIGASLVEIMRESYFYKIVDKEDLDLIDVFRETRPLSYIIAPIIASIVLQFGFQLVHTFIILAALLFVAAFLPFRIKDSK